MLLEHIWDLNADERVGVNSGEVYRFLQGRPERRSRASVIMFLNDMVEEGVLVYEEASGKGGYHRVYYPKMNREQFANYVVETITKKLAEIFPSVQS